MVVIKLFLYSALWCNGMIMEFGRYGVRFFWSSGQSQVEINWFSLRQRHIAKYLWHSYALRLHWWGGHIHSNAYSFIYTTRTVITIRAYMHKYDLVNGNSLLIITNSMKKIMKLIMNNQYIHLHMIGPIIN